MVFFLLTNGELHAIRQFSLIYIVVIITPHFRQLVLAEGPVIGVSTSSLMLRTSPRGPCNCFPILLLKKLRLREGENTGFYKHRFQDVLTRNRSFLPLFTCSSGSVSLTDKLQEENNEHLGPFPAASRRHGAALCL